jgi:hypothetical protein
MSGDRLAQIEGLLRDITGDSALTIDRVEEGSLRLLVSGRSSALISLDSGKLRSAFAEKLSMHLFGVVPADEIDELTELAAELLIASADLLSWPATLPGGETIERPELSQLLSITNDNRRSATALIGAPGSGKSALLARLGKTLVQRGYPVLAIKADLLDTRVNNEADLRERLDLSDRPSTIIARLAAFRPTFLIIDQLDALAGYLDLRTGRLSTLLNLVRRLGRLDNVHIVLSARAFEYEHDVRLRAISAESLHLQLPAWSQVLSLLEAKQISAAGWPRDAQEELRSPQALATYLQLEEGSKSEPLASYHAMLDRLWAERVLRRAQGASLSQLAYSLADTMAEEESLWLARTRFENVNDQIEALIAAGILTPSTSGASIGFTHQTVFDYALARGFAQEKGRLSSYVLERQASLFVRPKLWAALTYLRSADIKSYLEEFAAIWLAPGLRRHLRLLLIDFLGQQSAPTDREVLRMESALSNAEERAAAFRAMSGSSGWFKRFGRSYFAEAMSEGSPASDWMISTLIAAWASDSEGVERLLVERWLPHSANDTRTWQVIEYAPKWTEVILAIATAVLCRTNITSIHVEHVVSTIGVDQPEIALKLVRARFDAELLGAEGEAAKQYGKIPPTNVSHEEQIAWYMRSDPRKALKSLFESRNGWDTLPSLAEKAPILFLLHLWPWYLAAFRALQRYSEAGDGRLGFPLEYEADFRFESEHSLDLPESPLLAAVRIAAEKLAVDAPVRLREWVQTNCIIELAPVQRLIAHSFTLNPAEFAHDALEFLSTDPRRLHLGGIENFAGTTTRLIIAVSDFWSEAEIFNFERLVWTYRPPVPGHLVDAQQRRVWRNLVRQLKVNVLRALPARRASEQTKKRLAEEERAFPRRNLGVTFGRVRTVGSIMSAAAMSRAPDEDVINAFQQLPDSTMWTHPRDWEKGGNIQLAREFANLAKAEPGRAFRLIEQFQPEFGERGAGYALDAMSELAEPTKVMATVVNLARRGFAGTDFRASSAMAVGRLLDRQVEIAEPIVELFKQWLFTGLAKDEIEEVSSRAEADKDVQTEEENVSSLLWGHGGISILPGGSFFLLEVLVRIYLSRNDIPGLLSLIEEALKHLPDQKYWQNLLMRLAYLPVAKGEDAVRQSRMLEEILDRFPGLMGTPELAFLLGHVHWWTEDFVEREVRRWRYADSGTTRQGYGELVALLALLHPEREWSKTALTEIEHGSDKDARTGVATTAVNLWNQAAHRSRSTALLVRLLTDATEREWSAIFDLFRIVDELTPEPNTVLLLETIAEKLEKAPRLDSTFVIDRLQTLLPHEASLVARLAEGLIGNWNADLRDIRTGTAATAPQLVDLAVTLHRLGPATREEGTRLFEKLLELDAYAARATLDEIDSRFRQERAPVRPRLSRRARRQRRVSG